MYEMAKKSDAIQETMIGVNKKGRESKEFMEGRQRGTVWIARKKTDRK